MSETRRDPALQPRRQRKQKPPVDPNAPPETKAEKFTRLANRRVSKVLRGLSQLRNLASRATYAYTPEQAAKVVKHLKDAVADVESRFNGKPDVTASFTL